MKLLFYNNVIPGYQAISSRRSLCRTVIQPIQTLIVDVDFRGFPFKANATDCDLSLLLFHEFPRPYVERFRLLRFPVDLVNAMLIHGQDQLILGDPIRKSNGKDTRCCPLAKKQAKWSRKNNLESSIAINDDQK